MKENSLKIYVRLVIEMSKSTIFIFFLVKKFLVFSFNN
jgi:hypothetical protein